MPVDEQGPRYRLGLIVAMLAMAAIPIGVTGANLAFPALERHFDGTARSTLSWALTGYSIVIAAFTLLGGQLTDRLGSYRMFLIGIAAFGAFNVLAGFAPTPGVLIVARALQGAGGALIVPSSLAVALARCPEDRRTFTIGVWTASFPIGSSFAPVVASVLLDISGWRAVFLTAGGMCLVVLLAAIKLGDVAPADAAARTTGIPDILGVTIGTVAVGLVALGIVQGHSWGWTSASTLAAVVSGALLVPVFVRRSLNHPRPLVNLDLFGIRSFRVANVANIFVSVIGVTTWLLWPLLMTTVWRYSQLKVGLAMTPTPVIGGIGSILSARYAQRHGHRRLLVGGSCFLVASCASFALLPTVEPNYWTGMFPVLVLMGFGMGMTFAPLNGAALVDVPTASIGQANGVFATGRFLSGALGIAAVIAALDGPSKHPLDNFDDAFVLISIVAVGAFAVLFSAWERRDLRPCATAPASG